jgi:alanyl-tRNA synthetase
MIQIIEKISGKSYKLEENKKSIRIIADHLRAAAFLIANGVEPANVAQGYILRRLIRRAIRHGRLLGISNKLTSEVAQEAIKGYTDTFPELTKNREKIRSVLLAEEEKFQKTLDRGLREWDKCVNMFRNLATIPGEKAFYLYESFGFPPELIQELASERGMKVDMDGFQKALISHQKLSQTASAGMFKGGLVSHSEGVIKLHTATHLLQAALKIVLGQSIHQAGSNITSERLRFDFPYPQKLTPEQIRKIEEIVNQKIRENLPVKMEIMPLSDAKKQGALGFFEKKYQDKVKVYSIGGFSKEICGGPHVDFTGKLGSLKIIKEEKVSSSLRRIYAALNH